MLVFTQQGLQNLIYVFNNTNLLIDVVMLRIGGTTTLAICRGESPGHLYFVKSTALIYKMN